MQYQFKCRVLTIHRDINQMEHDLSSKLQYSKWKHLGKSRWLWIWWWLLDCLRSNFMKENLIRLGFIKAEVFYWERHFIKTMKGNDQRPQEIYLLGKVGRNWNLCTLQQVGMWNRITAMENSLVVSQKVV